MKAGDHYFAPGAIEHTRRPPSRGLRITLRLFAAAAVLGLLAGYVFGR